MIAPSIGPRIEKQNDAARIRIDRGEVCALKCIAVNTGQSKVVQCGLAAVLPGDDVIWFMREEHAEAGDAAILTAPGSTLENGGAERLRYVSPPHAA